MAKNIQDDLNRIQGWLDCNKLKLNIKKTKMMFLSSKRGTNLSNILTGPKTIGSVNSSKYLEVLLPDELKFKKVKKNRTVAEIT